MTTSVESKCMYYIYVETTHIHVKMTSSIWFIFLNINGENTMIEIGKATSWHVFCCCLYMKLIRNLLLL